MLFPEQKRGSWFAKMSTAAQTKYIRMWRNMGCSPFTAQVILYATTNVLAQVRSVAPLFIFLIFLRSILLQQQVDNAGEIMLGLLAVIFGLFFFLEGLKHAMMPMGGMVGEFLPQKYSMLVVLAVSFVLGVLVTYAEPAVSALLPLGSLVKADATPYLYALLHEGKEVLVLSIGLGVGVAALVGILSFTKSWSLKPLILFPLIPALLITMYMQWGDLDLAPTIGLAWDTGAVTTGPVTVPIILALGIGTSKSKSTKAETGGNNLGGLGLVTLASLFPVWIVQMFIVAMSFIVTKEDIYEYAENAKDVVPSKFDKSPLSEFIFGFRAVLPLVAFLLLTLKFIIREDLPSIKLAEVVGAEPDYIPTSKSGRYALVDSDDSTPMLRPEGRLDWIKKKAVFFTGLLFSQGGIILFFIGITFGLKLIGEQVGTTLPTLYRSTPYDDESPHIKNAGFGLFVLLFLVWVLGVLVTLAEPALQVMGTQVEELTKGSFKKIYLVLTVAFGVGLGVVLGVLRILFEFELAIFVIVGYIFAYILTIFSKEEFVRVAWDSAGVTTGPVTVPFVLSLGLAFGRVANAKEGFGILTCASFCPIVCVLLFGFCVRGWEYITRKNKTPSESLVRLQQLKKEAKKMRL